MIKKVVITAAEIGKGKQGHPSECPVALALGREGFREVHVGIDSIAAEWEGNYYGFPISRRLRQWMNKFDKGLKCREINFIVNIYP